MELELKTIENIRNLNKLYASRLCDENYFDNFIDILNTDQLFSNQIKIKDDDVSFLETDIYNFEIYRNLEKLAESIHKKISDSEESRRIEKFNTIYQIAIFHEVAHIYQALIAYEEIEKEPVIKALYKQYIEYWFRNYSNIQEKLYYRFHDFYFFEHNANIEALNTQKNIEPNKANIINEYILFIWLYNYKRVFNKVLSPVLFTFSLMQKKTDIIPMTYISMEEALNNGLPISLKEYLEIKNTLKNYNEQETEEIIKRIQRMR